MTAAIDPACHGLACLGSGLLASVATVVNIALALGLFGIFAALVQFSRRKIEWLRHRRTLVMLVLGWLFLLGTAHLIEGFAAGTFLLSVAVVVKGAAAVVGFLTAWQLWGVVTRSELAQPATTPVASDNSSSFADLAQTIAVEELETARRELESRVEERTRELSLVKARLETALRGAYVHAFSQDRDLRYTWVYDPDGPAGAEEMIGRTDADILPADICDAVVATKRNVLATGLPETCEVAAINGRGRALFSLHIEPALGAGGKIEGLTGAAIDISRVRSLESEQRRLADELRTALHHYEIALRGSHVTLFTQDHDLRFSSVSNPLFGKEPKDVVGHTDAEIFLPQAANSSAHLLARL